MNPFASFVSRPGEKRLGDLLESQEAGQGQYVFVGVPEDIGVRANQGRPGASLSPKAIFQALAQFPVNALHAPQIGWDWIEVEDLQSTSEGMTDLDALRALVAEVDKRVVATLQPLFAAGKTPILVGGGHNNAYPLLVAGSQALGKLNALNLDPHPDCRAMEGRHSGNGFHYALDAGALNRYVVLGMSEWGCNQASLAMMNQTPGWTYIPYEAWAIRGEMNFDIARTLALQHVNQGPFGLEVCADGIAHCPSSAQSHFGWSWEDVAETAYLAGQSGHCAYFHLAEVAIGLCPEGQKPALARAAAYAGMQFIQGCMHPNI
ncbi:MAG: hypothetical protein ABR88_07745 [Cryomorphaceae bacterium BACL7 MAG-120322-bin74]|jgi:formiminoglutamase|nr:MAG: hypothetical protein ABR88_07745 [Cryomorphaceae bacterium BACL7 MAG-120322-bin74]KRO83205.1 MAG: hypothetical protein ABR87_03215 [Cryomorphaceae bacterium BACL7 MAG-121220-bin83]